jgi:ATP-binding cassette subfamily C protein
MNVLRLRGAAPLLKDFRSFAGRRYPAALLLMWAAALAEGVGILALVPLLAMASNATDLPEPLRGWLSAGGGGDEQLRLAAAVGLFLVAMVARALLLYHRDQIINRLSEGYLVSLRLRAAAGLAAAGWSRAALVGQGGLQSLLLADIPRCANAVHYWQLILVAVIMLLVQFVLAAFLSPTMALIVLGLILAGLALSWRWLARGARSGIAISDSSEQSSAAAARLHAGLKAALAQGSAPAFLREYGASLTRLSDAVLDFARDHARARALASAAAAICAALLLVIGHAVLDLPFALLVTLLILFARMSGPAQQLQQALQSFAANSPSFVPVAQQIGTPRDLALDGKALDPLAWEELAARDLGYRHAETGRGIEGVSFSLKPGQWIGLAGASGAGKTTLIDLVAGLLSPTKGHLLVDGRPLEGERLERWRSGLAYVGQADLVFDETVRGNLLAEGSEVSDQRLWEVIDIVGLGDRVRSIPAGLEARVGDLGSALSGGERQRLVLARALLRGASLMILDEATNALDPAAEIELLGRLRALQPRPAALLVAHRAAPLELCDQRLEIGPGLEAPVER